MRWTHPVAGALLALAAAVAFTAAGCNQAENKGDTKDKVAKKGDKDQGKHNVAGRDWCAEHGMPESICVQCNPDLAAKYQEKGDWCKEHDRPESQCFICHPELKAKFAAEYNKEYGEDPPPMKEGPTGGEAKKEPKQ